MKIQDLENGMIVTLRYGNECLLVDDKLIANNFRLHNKLDNYNDNLTSKTNKQCDIVKVQSFNKVDTLWERKEIDWSKVPFGAKVRVWDSHKENALEGKFISYDKEYNDEYPFFTFVSNEKDVRWKHCELIEEVKVEAEIPTYGEIDIAFENYCRSQHDGCSKCEIRAENCEIEYILKNYNVTKK